LRDVFYPVLKFNDEKQNFAKVEERKVDFFHGKKAEALRVEFRASDLRVGFQMRGQIWPIHPSEFGLPNEASVFLLVTWPRAGFYLLYFYGPVQQISE